MASQPEISNFDATVYQYETTDPVQGGVGGIDNAPILSLTNRTRWLFDAVTTLTAHLAGYVQAGTGLLQQAGHRVALGWDGLYLRATVDNSDLGPIALQSWINGRGFITAATAPVRSVNGRGGDVTVSSGDITGGLGYVPVHQGNGPQQLPNTISFGWSVPQKVRCCIDGGAIDLGNVAFESWVQGLGYVTAAQLGPLVSVSIPGHSIGLGWDGYRIKATIDGADLGPVTLGTTVRCAIGYTDQYSHSVGLGWDGSRLLLSVDNTVVGPVAMAGSLSYQSVAQPNGNATSALVSIDSNGEWTISGTGQTSTGNGDLVLLPTAMPHTIVSVQINEGAAAGWATGGAPNPTVFGMQIRDAGGFFVYVARITPSGPIYQGGISFSYTVKGY